LKSRKAAFTLVELLVVLAVIAILSALLFPVFSRARESGRQTACASNLHQIWMAVSLYYNDEKRYPTYITDILPNTDSYFATTAGPSYTATDASGLGYFKGGQTALICPDDSTQSAVPRTSYGDLSDNMESGISSESQKNGLNTDGTVNTSIDPGRYVWNGFGYDVNGWALTPAEAASGTYNNLTVATGGFSANNPIKNSLYNRFANPSETIVTHCIFHRTNTGANIGAPGELNPSAGVGSGSRDILLLLDGTVKTMDVSTFQTGGTNQWQSPTFN